MKDLAAIIEANGRAAGRAYAHAWADGSHDLALAIHQASQEETDVLAARLGVEAAEIECKGYLAGVDAGQREG